MSGTASSSTTNPKKQCTTCSKSGGVMICDGCQQAFCGKHVIEHRQQLGGQLDQIIQDFDGLQLESQQPPSKGRLDAKIDRWEKESIAKIQQAAENARKNLQVIIDENKEEIKKQMAEIGNTLRSSREADDFSEFELNNWLKQLKKLQKEISTPSSAEFIYEKESPINLITVRKKKIENTVNTQQQNPSTNDDIKRSPVELFFQYKGALNLADGNCLATHLTGSESFAYIRGQYIYRNGSHVIRFRIEKSRQPYRIFFGCMSNKQGLKENSFKCPEAVGWFGFDQVYEHGRCYTNAAKYGYKSSQIVANDYLQLVLDCDQHQIRLIHERLKTTCKLSVNTNLAPFPWQFLVALYYPEDSVRIVNTA